MSRIIVAGLSGAGRTLTLKFLQDMGYFTVDNLPVTLMDAFFRKEALNYKKCALGLDIREKENFEKFVEITKNFQPLEIIFLDCSTETARRRFIENKRKPPLAKGSQSISVAVEDERRLLRPIRAIADLVIDTSGLTPWQLKKTLFKRIKGADVPFQIDILSFGYKYGIPQESDMVFDARFLPNPNYIGSMAHLSGKSKKVAAYVRKSPVYKKTMSVLAAFLGKTLPLYEKTGKSYFTVSVGCTGGRHRSVVFAEDLKKFIPRKYAVRIVHRDIKK
ncbi:MAG: RNase adapter RapZ [Elusimicrobia bacterium]|nr:RNase adapter RapZ [Elusimicrobiota bacterium]